MDTTRMIAFVAVGSVLIGSAFFVADTIAIMVRTASAGKKEEE